MVVNYCLHDVGATIAEFYVISAEDLLEVVVLGIMLIK